MELRARCITYTTLMNVYVFAYMFVQVIHVSIFLLFSFISHSKVILACLFKIHLFKHIDTIHKKKN